MINSPTKDIDKKFNTILYFNVLEHVEEDKLDDIGKMALVSLLGEAKKVEMGEIIELVTSFIPASSRDRHYEV